MKQELILCDFCGEILYGKKGISDVRKDYISFIPNKITFEQYQGKDWRAKGNHGEYDWGYVNKRLGQEFMFCNSDCLMDWLRLSLKPENLKWQSSIDKQKESLNYEGRESEDPLKAGVREGYTPRKSYDKNDFKYAGAETKRTQNSVW
jgi:ribosomal protein L24E